MPDVEIKTRKRGNRYAHSLEVDGKRVGGLEVVDLMMRIGSTAVRMGGIANVEMNENHRGHGYARRVLEYSTDWMTTKGFDCATLFGISHFYDKYGYAVCFPSSTVKIPTRYAEKAVSTLTSRHRTLADFAAMKEIYAANNAEMTGSLVRTEKSEWFQHGSDYNRSAGKQIFVFTDAAGTVQAYLAYDEKSDGSPIRDECVVCELGVRQWDYLSDIVHHAAERAIAMRVESIQFCVPPESIPARYLARFGAEQVIEYPACSDGMGRLIRQESFFRKTLPEWTKRAASVQNLPSGLSLELKTDIGSTKLTWTGRQIVQEPTDGATSGQAQMPQFRLMQMAMGYEGAETVLLYEDVKSDGDIRLLHTLFPRKLPYMWMPDHF
jgi:hypothetical protein